MASHPARAWTGSVNAGSTQPDVSAAKLPGPQAPAAAAAVSQQAGTAAGRTTNAPKQAGGPPAARQLPKSATRPRPSGPITLGSLVFSALDSLDPPVPHSTRPQTSQGTQQAPARSSRPPFTGTGVASEAGVPQHPPRGGREPLPVPLTNDGRTVMGLPTGPRRHGAGLLFGRKVDTIQFGLAQAPPPPTQPGGLEAAGQLGGGVRRPAFSYAAALKTEATKAAAASQPTRGQPVLVPSERVLSGPGELHPAASSAAPSGPGPGHDHGDRLSFLPAWEAGGNSIQGTSVHRSGDESAGQAPATADVGARAQDAQKPRSSMMSLVRDAALSRDPEAIAQLVKILGPSDLSMLRLLAFKAERKLQAAKAKAAETIGQLHFDAVPGGKATVLLSGGGQSSAAAASSVAAGTGTTFLFGAPLRPDLHASKASSAAEKEREKAERLLGLEGVIESGFRTLEKEEKEKARQARKAAWTGAAATGGEEPIFGKAAHRALVARLQREKLVRAWIFTALRAKLRDVRAAAAAATQAHAHMLAQQAKKAARVRAKTAAAVAAATASAAPFTGSAPAGAAAVRGTPSIASTVTRILPRPQTQAVPAVASALKAAAGSTDGRAASGQGGGGAGAISSLAGGASGPVPSAPGGRQVHVPAAGGSKGKLTKLKKILLRERLDRWLDANPEAREVYSSARAVHLTVVKAQRTAEEQARAQLREAAEKVIRAKEARRLLRKIKRGKIAVPSVKKANAVGRMVLTPGEPDLYARILAGRVLISRKRLRKEINKLVESGKYTHPLTAAEEAAEQARAAAVPTADSPSTPGQSAAALPSSDAQAAVAAVAGDKKKGEEKASAASLAAHLASVDITYSTRKADIVKMVPKVRPGMPPRTSTPAPLPVPVPPANAHLPAKVDPTAAARGADDDESEVRNTDAREEAPQSDTSSSEGEDAGGGGARPTGPVVSKPVPRAYVDQEPSAELDEVITEMISTALFYQEKAKKSAEEEGAASGAGAGGGKGKILKSKRRLLSGLREVAKGCRNGKVKMVVVAPNIDQSSVDGGLDDAVSAILHDARCADPPVPVIFALNRRKLGRALGSTLRASVVGLLSFENMRGMHNRAVELSAQLRAAWVWNRSEEGQRAKAAAVVAEKAAAEAAKLAAVRAKEEAKEAAKREAASTRGGGQGQAGERHARWQSALEHAGQVPDFVPSPPAWVAQYAAQMAASPAWQPGYPPGFGPGTAAAAESAQYQCYAPAPLGGGSELPQEAQAAQAAMAAAAWAQYMALQATAGYAPSYGQQR